MTPEINLNQVKMQLTISAMPVVKAIADQKVFFYASLSLDVLMTSLIEYFSQTCVYRMNSLTYGLTY